MASFMSLLKAGATREQLEEWCRTRAQSYMLPQSFEVACRVLGKYIMFGQTGDIAITPHLALDGIWEPWVTMAIARHLKPGMRCLDVGACYGYYALLMADAVGGSGIVQAWEPVWSETLLANVNINGLNIEVVRALMGSTSGEYEYRKQRPPFNAGDVRLTPRADGSSRPAVPMRIPSGAWDFIKIDVEGAEADVWKALAGVREESGNLTVCMEFTPSQHESPEEFLVGVVADGFELGTVGHDGVPRKISYAEALVPDTGGFRMLWLTRAD